MSGVVKSIKKVFKKVIKVIKKIIKPVAIAVAAYFTAGIALSFIPATSAFAASLPGFAGGGLLGTGIGAGATAGTGIFSSAASAIGLGGGLASGAASIAAEASAAAAAAGATAGTTAAGFFPTTATVAAGDTLGVLGAINPAAGFVGAGAGTATGAVAGGATVGAAATKVGFSLTDKLLLAKVGTDVAGALFGPSPEDIYEAEAEAASKFRGAFYGMEADGVPAAPGIAAPAVGGQQPLQLAAPGATPEIPGVTAQVRPPPPQKGLFGAPSVQNPQDEEPVVAAGLYGEGQMKQQIPVPQGLFAPTPGVRYV